MNRSVILAGAAYLVSLPLIAAATFVAVLFLAGPHAGLLPGWAEAVVLLLGWGIVLVCPAWIARIVWRRARQH